MRLRAVPVSRADRIASTAAASGMTIAAALLVFTSAPSRFVPVAMPAGAHEADPDAQRIAYVRPMPTPAAPPVRPVMRSRTPARPRAAARPTDERRAGAPRPNAAVPDSSAGAPAPARTSPPSLSRFERDWTAHGISPLLLPNGGGAPASGGSAHVPSALFTTPPQADRDAQLRAQAMADMAAKAAGVPMSPSARGGVTLDAPIPFGGPSRAQRKRDSTINAQTKAVLQRIWQRLDSIAAARRRRHADSLGAGRAQP